MRVKLKDFQAGAVERLLSSMGKMQELYERDGMLSAVSLTAPTGSGKTVLIGFLILPLVSKPLMWVLCILAGSACGAVMLGCWRLWQKRTQEAATLAGAIK